MTVAKPTRVQMNIMYSLAVGKPPWWDAGEPEHEAFRTMYRSRGTYYLCCGHAMGPKVAAEFIEAGLIEPCEHRHGGPAVKITVAGIAWAVRNWRPIDASKYT